MDRYPSSIGSRYYPQHSSSNIHPPQRERKPAPFTLNPFKPRPLPEDDKKKKKLPTGGWTNLNALLARTFLLLAMSGVVAWAIFRAGTRNFHETWWLLLFASPLVCEITFACVYGEAIHQGRKKVLGFKW